METLFIDTVYKLTLKFTECSVLGATGVIFPDVRQPEIGSYLSTPNNENLNIWSCTFASANS
jgi:hypothetical protein